MAQDAEELGDKVGRRKPSITLASFVMLFGSAMPLLMPNMTGMIAMSPGIAAVSLSSLGSFPVLFVFAIIFVMLAAVAVEPIRGVK
ncbi:hypothetical protein [Sanguibacter sp. HDW7]|uniref:hypothetical protein n=1 Tax=Sanguibacter sp. HDW7 TaxID=2714931 RepID=UPI00140DD02D|nr:hypothetical protein [Sanguibacter sp. HDW7]QIK83135.1 hypothetical protein G7063_05440 [Sanguibacter sp. HDW7]